MIFFAIAVILSCFALIFAMTVFAVIMDTALPRKLTAGGVLKYAARILTETVSDLFEVCLQAAENTVRGLAQHIRTVCLRRNPEFSADEDIECLFRAKYL